jgi:hypothetical protein
MTKVETFRLYSAECGLVDGDLNGLEEGIKGFDHPLKSL